MSVRCFVQSFSAFIHCEGHNKLSPEGRTLPWSNGKVQRLKFNSLDLFYVTLHTTRSRSLYDADKRILACTDQAQFPRQRLSACFCA